MKEASNMSGPQKGKRRGPKTDNTDEQQKSWLFKPGQSGNPAGRPKGSRNKLAQDFLADTYQQWQQHGSKALETMATSEPSKFCQMVAGLLPKESVLQDERVQLSEIKLVIVNADRNKAVINNAETGRFAEGIKLVPTASKPLLELGDQSLRRKTI
jgi:hypothetical protein